MHRIQASRELLASRGTAGRQRPSAEHLPPPSGKPGPWRHQEGSWLVLTWTWKQKRAQLWVTPTSEKIEQGGESGQVSPKRQHLGKTRRWEPCTSWENITGRGDQAEVLQAEGLVHLGNREETAHSEWPVGYRGSVPWPLSWRVTNTGIDRDSLAAHTGWTWEQRQKQRGWGQSWV